MNKKQRIMELLCTGRKSSNSEFAKISLRYGGVFHRLKHEGWVIGKECLDESTGHWVYWLQERPLIHVEEQIRTDAVMPVSLSCGGANAG